MQKQRNPIGVFLRIVSVLLLALAIIFVALPTDLIAHQPRLIVWAAFGVSLACFVTMWGLATLLEREAQAPPEVRSSLTRIEHQVTDLHVKVKELYLISDRAARITTPPAIAQKDYSPQFHQLNTLVQEVRDLSLLPDAERRQRAHVDKENRKLTMINELFGMIGSQNWPNAERLLIKLQTEFPNDDDVAKGRSYLEHSRGLVEEETIQKTSRDVDELIARASWDIAWEKVRALTEGFPASPDARALHNRVQREYDTYCDTTAQRLFEGIRHDIDQRNWRQALARAEQVLHQFPSHKVSEGLRMQLKTLQENAEIQERQELEVRIQEMVHDGQISGAIELAEDVIRRFPLSPQADSLETLLPRLRQLAAGVAAS